MDYEIALFQATLEKYVTDSRLPATVKKMVLADLLSKVTIEANEAIVAQAQAEKEAEKEAENE